MKKIIVIAIAFIGMQAIAQGQKKQGQRNHDDRQGTMMNLSAEEMATLQTKKMILELDLNDSQAAKIKAINLENATNRKAMMADRKAKKEDGAPKKPTQEERYAMANAKLDHQIAMKAKMKDILDKDQFEKWEKAQKRMAMKGKHDKKDSNKKDRQSKRG